MKENLKKTLKSYPLIKSIVKSFYFIYKIISDYFIKLVSIIFWLKPIQNNKIVICNYFGKGYGDNGKYIAEEIIKQNLDYDIVWLLKKDLIGKVDFPEKIRVVKYKSFKALYEMATAKIWIDNCRKVFYPPKRKGQYYIQTWHGSIPLKRIEKDAEENLSSFYIYFAKQDSKIADFFLSNSEFCTKIYQNSFWYNGEILEIGSPRCDIFFKENTDINKKIKKLYNIERDAKIAIYAPTFRQDENLDIYDIDFNRLLETLENTFGGKWVILIRLHPNISNKANFIRYNEKIINATDYDDMYELLSASDILFTDYSSTMFEFSLKYKPVFLYCRDIAKYRGERNFYCNLEKLPYQIAENNDQLIQEIQQFNEEEYKRKVTLFFDNLKVNERGTASKEVVKLIQKITIQ